MKRVLVAIILLLSFSSPCLAGSFPDLPDDHWGTSYAERMKQEGIMNGDSKGRFHPSDSVNRAELAKIAIAIARKKGTLKISTVPGDAPVFGDIPKDVWYAQDALLCFLNDWIRGYSDSEGKLRGIFGGSDAVTRAQAIKVLLLASGQRIKIGRFTPFTDVTQDMWHATYVQTAKSLGIVSGAEEGRFYPDRPLSRVELAKIAAGLL